MSKLIGIVACTSEGAALCYRTICLEGSQYYKELVRGEIREESRQYFSFIINRLKNKGLCH